MIAMAPAWKYLMWEMQISKMLNTGSWIFENVGCDLLLPARVSYIESSSHSPLQFCPSWVKSWAKKSRLQNKKEFTIRPFSKFQLRRRSSQPYCRLPVTAKNGTTSRFLENDRTQWDGFHRVIGQDQKNSTLNQLARLALPWTRVQPLQWAWPVQVVTAIDIAWVNWPFTHRKSHMQPQLHLYWFSVWIVKEVIQHPLRARCCGFGEKDRRPIDPPPVLQLFVEGEDGELKTVRYRSW